MENNEEEKKKKKGGFIMGALIAAIALLLGTSVFFGWKLSDTQNEVKTEMKKGEDNQQKHDRLLADLNKTKDLLEQAKTGDPAKDQELQAKSAELEKLREKLKNYEAEGDIEYFRKLKAELWKLRSEIRDLKKKNEELLAMNAQLTDENGQAKEKINSLSAATKDLKQSNQALDAQARLGAKILARDIIAEGIRQRRNSEKVTHSPRNVEKIRVAFTLSATLVARPGNKTLYLRATSPDGQVFTNGGNTFSFEGRSITFSEKQEIDYQNQDKDVIMYASPFATAFVAGKYTLEVYLDGYLLGTAVTELK